MHYEYLNEVWKDIKGYEGLYQVSNYGRVKSMERIVTNNSYSGKLLKETILKLHPYKSGYILVNLWKNQKSKTFLVHRLVAQAFIPNPHNYPQVNHKDENKQNNFVWVNEDGTVDLEKSNLEWCDRLYNTRYGTRSKRSAENKCKPVYQYDKNGNFIKEWKSVAEAVKELGFQQSKISSCCLGKRNFHKGFIWKYKRGVE